MTEIYLVRQGKSFIPAHDSDAESVQKLKHGQVYKADIVAPRNLQYHRKSFALLNLAYEYWQPETMVAEVERETVRRLQAYFVKHGISEDATKALCKGFIAELEIHRQEYETGKDFDSFRAWVTVQAGFYTVINSPAGPRKVPKSISFAAMDNVEFDNYYKQILNVVWQLCLHRIYGNQQQLAERLLNFE